ncbi:hypothetical protein [Terrabacter sp. Ter38]|uniref:hypothetical protein n=1 Tax=Terrabacter sp. Ter38 TaxID=2926030 RepID=UPI0021197FAB|nr:hypothetical protein [Terrabacter sp. Ter38]
MTKQPWKQYSKDSLPSGLAYPVGRDLIQHELSLAGASVTSLSFSRPDLHSGDSVLDIYWSGDVPRRVADVIPQDGFLLMTLMAIPSAEKRAIGDELRDRWIAAAANWIAAVADRGDAWRSMEHRWLLRRTPDRLSLIEA